MNDNIPMEGVVELFSSSNIFVDEEGLVSLNDVYRIAIERGLDGGKLEPKFYFRKSNPRKSGTSGNISESGGEGLQFVEYLAENLKVSATHIYKTKRGKGGGSFAHWKIALAYAKYLSHELHSHILETYARVATGDKTLAVEIIEKQKKPEDAEWIANRANAVVARNKFTKCLQEHGVTKGYEIAGCTNAVYQGMFEKTAKEIREERNLPANANLRDSMDETELLSIALAENLAKRKIQTTNSQGYTECKTRCLDASKIIADAVRNAL